MNDDILTIDEVARYLRVSERTVYDWAQKGEIPAGKIGSSWRFKKSELERWIDRELSGKGRLRPPAADVKVKNILSPERIAFLDYSTRRDALTALADALGRAPQVKDRKELTDEILRREELMSTAIGRGIALPHVRLTTVTDLVMAVGICRTPVTDFLPIDDEPVRLLFMIAAADSQHSDFLLTIAHITRRLRSGELREALIASPDSAAAYALLIQE